MPKLDKVQRDHIISRIHRETSDAISDKSAALKTNWTSDEIAAKLEAKGFIVQNTRYHSVTLPPTAAMLANKKKIEEFTDAAKEASRNAIDEVMLGDADGALEILRTFTKKLERL